MPKTADWKNALKAAGAETADLMTRQMQEEMLASGWDQRIVNRIKVTYFNNRFDIKIPAKLKDKVSNLEYGSPGSSPTAALRKFGNRTKEAETFLSQRVLAYMSGGK